MNLSAPFAYNSIVTGTCHAPIYQTKKNVFLKAIIPPILIILLGLALHASSLKWGFLYDDFIHQGVFRYSDALPGVQPWDLYDYGWQPQPGEPLFDVGLFPWWTAEDFSVRFFRPITSLSIYLDFLVYRGWAPGYHLTNLLLYGAILWFAYRLYVSIRAPRRSALWALAFLAFEGAHVIPVGWIANRNTLVALLFTVLMVLAYHQYCQSGRRQFLLLSLCCFLLALGAKESGITGLAFIGLYLLFIARPSESESFIRGCKRMLRSPSLWAYAFVGVFYLTGYALAGGGANSALYSVPWQDPIEYTRRLAMLIPLGFSSLFFGLSADIVFTRPQLALPMVAISLPVLGFLAFFFWQRLRSTPQAGFALGWSVAALMPVAGVFLSDRLLMDASVGTALLMGLFIDKLGNLRNLVARRQFGATIFFVVLVILGLVVPIATGRIRGEIFFEVASTDHEIISRAEIPSKDSSPRYVFLLNPPSSVLAMTMLPTWTVIHDDPGILITYLQMARREVTWQRDSDTSFVLTFGKPFLLEHQYERLFHTSINPPAAGTQFRTAQFIATVLETAERSIRSARFEFCRKLDDPSYFFLAWQDGRLSQITPPPVGESLYISKAIPTTPFAP